MEKVARPKEEQDNIGRAYPITPFELRFTDDEKDSLRGVLKKYDKTSVEEYIPNLEVQCQIIANILANPKKRDLRAKKEDMLKTFKTALRYLKNLSRGRLYILRPYEIFDVVNHDRLLDIHTFTIEAQDSAQQASGPIEKLIQILKEDLSEKKERPGRPTCDVRAGFIQFVAHSFSLHFESNPTAHKDGPFVNTIRVAFRAINNAMGTNLPSKDPSRPIAKALKNPKPYTF